MIKKLFLFVFFLAFASVNVPAQNNDYVFKNYDAEDGLCDNNVNSIVEDRKGFIWIGTKEGLSRFDGAEFHNYYFNSANGATGGLYWLHNLDDNRILLINTYRLEVLNTSKNTLTPVQEFKNIGIQEITQLTPSLFALNATDYFILVDSKLNRVGEIRFKGKVYGSIYIRKLSENKFLVSNCYDYYEYDLTTKKLSPFPLNMRKYQTRESNIFEVRFIDAQAKRIYVSDYFSGLYVFDYKGNLVQQYEIGKSKLSSTNFISFVKDTSKAVWIGTYNGINLLKNNNFEIINHKDENDLSLKSDFITCFMTDKNKNIWIGTNQGISVYKSKQNSNIGSIAIKDGSIMGISSLAFSGDDLFAGEYLGGVYKINSQTKEKRLLKNETFLWGVYNYQDTLYISGANKKKAIFRFDSNSNQFVETVALKNYFPKTDLVTMVFKHSNGDFWYSGNAGGGFVRKMAVTGKMISYNRDQKGKPLFSSSYYSNVCEDDDKNLWFGVSRSTKLLQWNYSTNTFKEIDFNDFKETQNIIFGGITSLKRDAQNFIWIAFEGGGIIKYNPRDNTIKNYNFKSGLKSNYVFDIEFDNHHRLWMITNKGIGCFDTQKNYSYNFTIWDGFTDKPSNYNTLKMDTRHNTMWIGAKEKIYYFNPEVIIKSKKPNTKIYLDYLKINQNTIDISKHNFDFSPNQNNIEFRLVAIDIENGKNIEYSYQLKGLNDQWHNLESNRTVVLQKLKAGKYVFNARVRSKGSNEWTYLNKSYSFQIANYWYQTWWFIMFSGIALIALTWFVIAYNFKKKLEKQLAVEEERNRIAADMHDDLGSGLTKITYLSQMALQKENNKTYLTSINKTSTELVESMSEIIWAMREENNSWEELLSYIKLYAQEYCQNNNLDIAFKFPEEEIHFKIIGEVRRHIFLSIKECLHNIVKHAEAKKVTITIEKKENIWITIQDDGKGIDLIRDKTLGGNGLKNITNRMKKSKAEFSIFNHNGTTVIFKIPY